ncbi:MAG: hypothetical protein Q8P97_02530, partial [bacterium]|nr:hypothetical protein [bacterium]
MSSILKKYKQLYTEDNFLGPVVMSLVFLTISLFANYAAGTYATKRASSSVTDIILSNIPVFDVDWIFVNGAILFFVGVALLILIEPKWMPFTLKSIALFVIVRSFFVSLTHLGPFPDQIAFNSNFILNKLIFGGDLFFSGHTGLPFLMALIFWNFKSLRIIFLIASVIFGASVLM